MVSYRCKTKLIAEKSACYGLTENLIAENILHNINYTFISLIIKTISDYRFASSPDGVLNLEHFEGTAKLRNMQKGGGLALRKLNQFSCHWERIVGCQGPWKACGPPMVGVLVEGSRAFAILIRHLGGMSEPSGYFGHRLATILVFRKRLVNWDKGSDCGDRVAFQANLPYNERG